MTTTWTAAHRAAAIDPHETLKLFPPRAFGDQTLRQTVRLAGGGEAYRIHLSNRYGRTPLEIAGAHAATRTRGGTIDTGTDTVLRFGGETAVTVPAGREITTDTVERPVTAGQELTLSLHLPGDTGPSTYSGVPYDTGHVAPGDQLHAETLQDAEELTTGHFLSGVDVRTPADTRIAVAFGDSWIAGAFTTPGTDHSIPGHLNRRLTRGWIVNQGLPGNRLLTDEVGEHLLGRLERDVLAVPGVSHVLVHIGVNDLGLAGAQSYPEPPDLPDTDRLKAGYTTLADRLHAAGLTAIGSTLGPYAGTVYDGIDTPEGQAVRRDLNAWLLGPDQPFDAVVDIAAAVADPHRPDRIRPEYNAGDGLHVNDAGAEAIARAVDLSLLAL